MFIYKITLIPTIMSYIGLVFREGKTLQKRIKQHKKQARKCIKDENVRDILHCEMRMYGIDNIVYEIIEDNINDFEYLCERQKFNIIKYDTFIDFIDGQFGGYNMTLGGEGIFGYHHNNETKKTISEASLKRNMKGENNPQYGIPRTQQIKENISKNLKQYWKLKKLNWTIQDHNKRSQAQKIWKRKPKSKQEKQKQSIRSLKMWETRSRIFKPQTQQRKIKISNSNKGKPKSEEHKRNISIGRKLMYENRRLKNES